MKNASNLDVTLPKAEVIRLCMAGRQRWVMTDLESGGKKNKVLKCNYLKYSPSYCMSYI